MPERDKQKPESEKKTVTSYTWTDAAKAIFKKSAGLLSTILGSAWRSRPVQFVRGQAGKALGKAGNYVVNQIVLDGNILYGLMAIGLPAVGDVDLSNPKALLSADISNECINSLEEYKNTLSGLPGYLAHYKKTVKKFVDELSKLLTKYQTVIYDLLSAKSTETAKYNKKLISCLGEIQKKCSDREIRRLTKKNLDQIVDKKVYLVKAETLIGDFAAWLDFAAKNTGEEIKNKQFQTNEALLDFIFGQNEKDNSTQQREEFREQLADKKKFFLRGLGKDITESLSSVLAGRLKRWIGQIAETTRSTLDPIDPTYTFPEFFGIKSAGAVVDIFKAYATTLKFYPQELTQYKGACNECIDKMLGILDEYIPLLKVFSKSELSKISVKTKFDARGKIRYFLDQLNKEIVSALNNKKITSVKGNQVGTEVVVAGKQELFVDGPAMKDFLEKMKPCVADTLKSLNLLLNLEENKINYDALNIEAPAVKKSKKAEEKPVVVSSAPKKNISEKIKEPAEIIKKRKYLTTILNEAIDIIKKAFKQKQDMDKAAKDTSFMSTKDTKGYWASKKRVLDKYAELYKTYKELTKANYTLTATTKDGKSEREQFPIELITKDNKVSAEPINALSVQSFPAKVVSNIIDQLITYVLDKLILMRKLKPEIDVACKRMKEMYKGESKDVEKERENLRKYMQQIIEAKKYAIESYEETKKLISNAERAGENRKINMDGLNSYQESVTFKYGAFRKFKTLSNESYELIDKDDNITGQIYKLDLSTLKELVGACPEILKSIKESSDEIDKLKKQVAKDYRKDLAALKKAEKTAGEYFDRVQSIVEEEARFSDEYKSDKKTYDVSKYPGLNNLFEECKKYNVEFLDKSIKIFTLENEKNIEDKKSLYNLSISELKKFIGNVDDNFPALKSKLSELEGALKKVDNLIAGRNSDYDKKCKELEALLDEIAKIRNAVDNDYKSKYISLPLSGDDNVYGKLLEGFGFFDYDEDEESGYLSRNPSGGYVVLKDRISEFRFEELQEELRSVSEKYEEINGNYKQWQDFMARQKKAYDEETSEVKKELQEAINIYKDLHAKLKKHGLEVKDNNDAQSIEQIIAEFLNEKYLKGAPNGKLSVNDAKLSDLNIDQLDKANTDVDDKWKQINLSKSGFDAFVNDKVEKGKEPAKRKDLKKKIENVLSVFRSAEKSMGRFIRKFKKKYPKNYDKHIFGEPVEKFDGILDIYKGKLVNGQFNEVIEQGKEGDTDIKNIVSHDYTYHTIDYDEIKNLAYPKLNEYIIAYKTFYDEMQKTKEELDAAIKNYKDEYQEKYDELEKTLKEIVSIECRIQKDAENLAVPIGGGEDSPYADFYKVMSHFEKEKKYLSATLDSNNTPNGFAINYKFINSLDYKKISEAVSFSKDQLDEIRWCKTSWDAYFKTRKEKYKKDCDELKKKLSEIISDYEKAKKTVKKKDYSEDLFEDNVFGHDGLTNAESHVERLAQEKYLIAQKDSYKINSKYISGLRGDEVEKAVSYIRNISNITETQEDIFGENEL